jgi:hypothetical protein
MKSEDGSLKTGPIIPILPAVDVEPMVGVIPVDTAYEYGLYQMNPLLGTR